VLQAVLLLGAGDQDRAVAAAKAAAKTATEDQHRAHTKRLGGLARHAGAVKATSVAALIDAYTTSISATHQDKAEAEPSRGALPPDA
jgi:hypothetical protein